MAEQGRNPELLSPRDAADLLRLPRGASNRSIGLALTRLGVGRIWIGNREWRVNAATLRRAIQKAEAGKKVSAGAG